jgi:segregation and condensation protein B
MYATTKEFLDYFSLKSLDELPSLDEIREIDDANQNLDFINAEKKASATREYDFDNDGDVETRGEEILAETELELEEAQRLVQQVEDNVFNKPSEEERLSEEAAAERVLADTFPQPSFTEMANKTQQRLSPGDDVSATPSVIDLADKIADHQARLASINTGAADASIEASTVDTSLSGPDEGLTLLQQQERLMQQLMQDEAQRQTQDVSLSESIENEEAYNEAGDEAFLLADAEAEKELLEKERLAEEALENELGFDDAGSSENSATEFGSSTKKNSLFDD